MSEGKEYQIRTVEDFLSVPDERLDLCLSEFAEWCRFVRSVDALNEAAGGAVIQVPRDVLRWVDDDKGTVTLKLKDRNGNKIGDVKMPIKEVAP